MILYEALPTAIEICESVSFAPKGDGFHARFANFLAVSLIGERTLAHEGKMLTPQDRLRWLKEVIIEDIGKWPDEGLAEILAIYDLYFPAANGKKNTRVFESMDAARPPSPILAAKQLTGSPDPELVRMIEGAAAKMKGDAK